MAKAKAGGEAGAGVKKSSAAKGSKKEAGEPGASGTKAGSASPGSKTGSAKAKSAESKSSGASSKGAAAKSAAPAKPADKTGSKTGTAAAKSAEGSKPGAPAKTSDTASAMPSKERPAAKPAIAESSPAAKPAEPEKAHKAPEAAKPVEAQTPSAPDAARSEYVQTEKSIPTTVTKPEPKPQSVASQSSAATEKSADARSSVPAPVAAPASTASAPAQKIPQWPDVETDSLDGVHLPVASGKALIFGGPKDRGVKRDDKLALPIGAHYQYELVRNLNPKAFYCAMRWEYRQSHMSAEEGKRWWANKRILVTANGKSVVVKAVDFGPHENSGFSVGLSPGAAEALGLEQGNEVEVKFADQKTQLGPVS